MIRWLLVGFGRAGRCHALAIEKTPNAKLVGVVDPIRQIGVPLGIDIFEALETALPACQPDAVVIATSHAEHLRLATMAVEAGIPVLCEKPVGRNAHEATRLLELATKHAVPVGVVLNQRACAHPHWIKQSLDQGAFACRAVRISGTLGRMGGWNVDPAISGGGVLRTVGIHYLDLLRWWFGDPIWHAGSLTGNPVDDVADLLLGFSGGVRASLTLSAVAQRAAGPVSILLEGECARIELRGHEIIACEGIAMPSPAEPAIPELSYGPGHLAVIGAATNRLMKGEPFPVSLKELVGLLIFMDDIYKQAGRSPVFIDRH